ncbi:MAG: PmbA/TldA family metallopeptidase, partial [Gammaproteobacteria bacterium]
MSDALRLARQTFLDASGLDLPQLGRVLEALMKPGVDAADLYFQHSLSRSWSLEDGLIKSGHHSVERGVGVRAVAGDKQGLAYSDELALAPLLAAAQAAGAIARGGQTRAVQAPGTAAT